MKTDWQIIDELKVLQALSEVIGFTVTINTDRLKQSLKDAIYLIENQNNGIASLKNRIEHLNSFLERQAEEIEHVRANASPFAGAEAKVEIARRDFIIEKLREEFKKQGGDDKVTMPSPTLSATDALTVRDQFAIESFKLMFASCAEQFKRQDVAIKEPVEIMIRRSYSIADTAMEVRAAQEPKQDDDEQGMQSAGLMHDAEPKTEQAAFEDWLHKTCPSGCCESVDAKWRMSSEYADWLDESEALRPAKVETCGHMEAHTNHRQWIPHVGNECPVSNKSAVIEVEIGIGQRGSGLAGEMYWVQEKSVTDIVKWRYAR